ncbi:hypothetical protein JCM11491_007224 [Sporobolomyces phaffii]
MPLLRPSPILYVGAFTTPPPPLASIPHLPSDLEHLERVEAGQVFRKWDFVSEFNRDCLRPSEIEPLRFQSDALADRVVDQLGFVSRPGLAAGKDAYDAVRDYVDDDSVERDPSDPVVEFWREMNQLPPDGVCGFNRSEDKAGVGHDRFCPLDAFGDAPAEPTLAEGQRVFWKYSGQIFSALMHFSLAGGFSSPKLAAVMHETNYLTSDAKEATYKRLLETTLFVLDAMEDMTVGTGRGWKSALRVRLLHAQVRRRILTNRGRYNKYDAERDGVPINQADLLAVLGAFAVGPVWSMARNGFPMSPREREAFRVAWRHVGYYLGIDPALLARYYGGGSSSSFATTESSFASLAYAIFPSGAPPADPYATPQYKILSSIAARPPRGKPVEHHLELCRMSVGPSLADQLAIPRGRWRDLWTVEVERLMSWGLVTFGDAYATYGGARGRRWEARRRDWFRWVVKLLVVWQLGERRTVFAWRDQTRHGEKLGAEEGEDSDLAMGPVVGRQVRKEWTSLLIEMGLVLGSAVVVGGAGLGLSSGKICAIDALGAPERTPTLRRGSAEPKSETVLGVGTCCFRSRSRASSRDVPASPLLASTLAERDEVLSVHSPPPETPLDRETSTRMETDSHFSPVPSPPPPSPSSPAVARTTGPRSLARTSRRAVFDLVSSPSPQSSFSGPERTALQERLERTSKVRIAVKPGVPARLLSDHELDPESSNSSSGVERQHDEPVASDDSPWFTDSDPPTRTSTPVTRTLRRQSKLIEGALRREPVQTPGSKRGEAIRVEGFDVRDPHQPPARPPPPNPRPALSRSTNSSTSSLSLMLARPLPSTSFPQGPPPPSQRPSLADDDHVQPYLTTKQAGRTWNGEIVAATLASQSRTATPSTSPTLRKGFTSRPPSPSLSCKVDPATGRTTVHPLSTSASLPSLLARSTSTKRTRFLTPSVSLTSTPESSPPRSSTVLQFTRRPTCTRQGGHLERSRAGSTLSPVSLASVEATPEETEVEEGSEGEELEFNRFQPSIFASHYSNSATSLSSASSSSMMRASSGTATSTSSLSSSPKSTRSGFSCSVPPPRLSPLDSPAPPSRKTSSDPIQRVNLAELRREQAARRHASEEAEAAEAEASETTTPTPTRDPGDHRRSPDRDRARPNPPPLRRGTTTSPVSPTSMPQLQVPWKKLFSLGG